MQTEVGLKILNPKMAGPLPTYAAPGSASLDLRACLDEAVILQPDDVYLVPTGLTAHLVSPAYTAVLLPRSDLGHKHGIVLDSLVGLIDSDYQGELRISLWSRDKEAFTIEPMEHTTQMTIVPVVRIAFKVVDEFATNERGKGEFGSIGRA